MNLLFYSLEGKSLGLALRQSLLDEVAMCIVRPEFQQVGRGLLPTTTPDTMHHNGQYVVIHDDPRLSNSFPLWTYQDPAYRAKVFHAYDIPTDLPLSLGGWFDPEQGWRCLFQANATYRHHGAAEVLLRPFATPPTKCTSLVNLQEPLRHYAQTGWLLLQAASLHCGLSFPLAYVLSELTDPLDPSELIPQWALGVVLRSDEYLPVKGLCQENLHHVGLMDAMLDDEQQLVARELVVTARGRSPREAEKRVERTVHRLGYPGRVPEITVTQGARQRFLDAQPDLQG